MSAAPALAFVWAAVSPKPLPAPIRSKPIETLAFYRKHTETLLRRYMQKSFEMGKTPSILGNCMFRGKASSQQRHSFEDTVNFVLDIDKCLKLLDKPSQEIVARVALQEYSQGEAAELMGQPLRSIVRRYAEAIDTLTEILLDHDLLNLHFGKSCQEGRTR